MAVDYDSKQYLESVDAYWRAANYLSAGTLFLMNDPLLRRPLKAEDVKPKPIGHWGTIVPLKPGYQEVRSGHVLHRRFRSRWPSYDEQLLPGRFIH